MSQQQGLEFFMANAWRWAAGLPEKEPTQPLPSLDEIKNTEWSSKFEELMRNRLVMGRFRYGPLARANKGSHDYIGSAIRRLEKYRDTGNDELLVDVANICLAEFVTGGHPKKHFRAEDDTEHIRANIAALEARTPAPAPATDVDALLADCEREISIFERTSAENSKRLITALRESRAREGVENEDH